MNTQLFYQDLLALARLKVTNVHTASQRITIYADVAVAPQPCPRCGQETATVNQYDDRQVQDLSISGKEVWLHLRIPQLVCPQCQRYFTATPDWIMPGKTYTRRQAKWIFLLCAKQPFTEVAALVNLSHKTVERLYYQMAEEQLDLPSRYARVRRLGIDEIAHRKGKGDFVCVLTDLDRGTQLDVLPDRKKATLMKHFQSLGPAFCRQIRGVSCDMWKPYYEVAQTCFSNAVIVIDRFHVVKALNQVLDQLRRHLRREDKDETVFKGIKWMLFKRPERCSTSEQSDIQAALCKSPLLAQVYDLRNQFNALFDAVSGAHSLQIRLQHWITQAEAVGNGYLDGFIKTLRNWFKPIAAYARLRISNAVTEGLNNYLRYFKRISFGLSNFEHMRLRILMATA